MIQLSEETIMKNWKNAYKPLVSICCITYNHEKFIAEALDSFLMQQTDFPFEIVIDDDCSTDNTANIIQNYVNKFPNIISANLRKSNVGAIKNAFSCLNRTKGDFLAFCEGDDYWIDEQKLQYQIDLMKKYPNCRISFHPSEIKNQLNLSKEDEDRILENEKETLQIIDDCIIYAKYSQSNIVIGIDTIIIKGGGFIPTSSVVIEKSSLDDFEMYLKSNFSDYIIQILGGLHGGALYIDKVMSTYRIHPQGMSSSLISNKEGLIAYESIILDSLIELDTFLNYKYHHAFQIIIDNKSKMISKEKNVKVSNTAKIELTKLFIQTQPLCTKST